MIRSLDTGDEKTYSNAKLTRIVQRPIWRPEGILIVAREPQGPLVVHCLDPRTGEMKELLRPSFRPGVPTPVFSPDGKTIYSTDFQDEKKTVGIFALDVSSGQERQIYQATAAHSVKTRILSLSPDMRTLAFELNDQLCVMSVDGTGFRGLYKTEASEEFPGQRDLAWSSDGRAIFFSVVPKIGGERKLMRISVEGGTPEFTGLATTGLRQIDVNPDGSRIAFNGGDDAKLEFCALDKLLAAPN